MTSPFTLVVNREFLAVHEELLLTPGDCERILTELWNPWKSALVVDDEEGIRAGGVRPEIRSVLSSRLTSDAAGWPMTELVNALARVNAEVFRFDIRGMLADDPTSVLRYEAESNDHYVPHRDAGESHASRKLTFVVQLSPGDGYLGGDLIISDMGKLTTREQGSLIVFPAFLAHTVTPVIRGTRHCIVGWLHGPTFR